MAMLNYQRVLGKIFNLMLFCSSVPSVFDLMLLMLLRSFGQDWMWDKLCDGSCPRFVDSISWEKNGGES